MVASPDITEIPFTMNGELSPLLVQSARFTRPMAGWLATWGKIGADGKVILTVDRDRQTFDATAEIGRVDWSPYLQGGTWNDTHDEGVIVGLPDSLGWHDESSALALAHGKVGLYTTGHLFDRDDPASWAGLTDKSGNARTPTDHEFERAEYFWSLAGALEGLPRTLALSAHGKMALSPCGSRIIAALLEAAAVCETPKNPDATLEPLRLGLTARIRIRPGMVGRKPCGACRCPVGACAGLLRKSGASAGISLAIGGNGYGTQNAGIPNATASAALVPEDLEQEAAPDLSPRELVLARVMSRYAIPRAQAEQWLSAWLASRTSPGVSL